MTYTQLAYLHLATVIPAFGIGTLQLLKRKGTLIHKRLGRIYMMLILTTAFITLAMPAQVGPQFLHHFGFIHAFSLLAIVSVPTAYFAARRGDLHAHRAAMIAL